MKPDQERVKNLLLDTVTLLCKNSLQYENKLRVEGLLGVSVDESDVFFLHISENFQNSTAVDTNNVSGKESEVVTDSNRESSHDREDVSSQIQDSRDSVSEQIRVKSEIHDVGSDSDDLIITSSSLNSPHTVAQPATVVAGQRRSPHKRTHSPSFRDSIHNSSQISQNSQRDSLNSTNQMTSLDGDYTYSECGDGTSFDQLQSQHMIKQETGWDQEPAAKRHMSDSSPWPNLAGLSDLAAQAAQASQDGDDGGGGSYSQPGCSSWPSASTPLLPNSGVQDTMFPWGRSDTLATTTTTSTPGVSGLGVSSLGSGGLTIHRHVCSECQSVFTNTAALEKHCALRHRGEKPWVCSVCAAAFARKDYLESHFRIHTGEKPFRCQLCPAAFRQKGKLNKHMSTLHRTEQVFAKLADCDVVEAAAAAVQAAGLCDQVSSPDHTQGEGDDRSPGNGQSEAESGDGHEGHN